MLDKDGYRPLDILKQKKDGSDKEEALREIKGSQLARWSVEYTGRCSRFCCGTSQAVMWETIRGQAKRDTVRYG